MLGLVTPDGHSRKKCPVLEGSVAAEGAETGSSDSAGRQPLSLWPPHCCQSNVWKTDLDPPLLFSNLFMDSPGIEDKARAPQVLKSLFAVSGLSPPCAAQPPLKD